MTGERVIVTVENQVAHVQLNRPEKKNGLDLEMFHAIIDAGERVLGDKSIRAVVLSGNGGCFCAGLDVQAVMSDPATSIPALMDERVGPANVAQRVGYIWREVEVPVVAAITGVAFGGGLQIAAGADIRLAAPDARLSIMESKYGLIPDMGVTQTLARILRPDVLKELTWTGRVVDAAEALSIGLVTRLTDKPIESALELAHTIAQKSPSATRASKRLFDAAPFLDVTAAFQLESDLQRPLLGSANQLEAVMANMERRPPNFIDE